MILKTHLPADKGFTEALGFAEELFKSRGLRTANGWVNATGLGARALVSDNQVYPVRGQTVVVKGEASMIRTRDGKGGIKYVLPRKGAGTTVLGGTKEAGNW